MTRMLVLLLLPGMAVAQGASYARDVRPFFAKYCLECHSSAAAKGGLVLETLKEMREGGKRGPAIVPGKPDEGPLVRMIERKLKPVMPPRKSRQPSPQEVAKVRAWVAAGATDDSATFKAVLPPIVPRVKVAPPVLALAMSGDGKQLAAGVRGGVVVFDAQKLAPTGKVPVPRDRVTALAYSRDGALAVAGSTAGEGHQVYVGGKAVLRHDDVVQALAFSPDGAVLASADYGRLIKVWHVKEGKAGHVLKDHSDSVYAVAFSPDGKLLASGGADRAVKVWDVATGNRLYTLGEPTDWVYAVAWSPDGKHLAAAGVDRSIRVWEVNRDGGKVVRSVFAHEGPVLKLAYSRDGKSLYSLGEDRVVKRWDAAKMAEIKAWPAQKEAALSLAVAPGGERLFVGLFDGALNVLGPDGKTVAALLPIKPKPPVLAKVEPSAMRRGATHEVRVSGQHLEGATLTAAGLEFRPVPGKAGAYRVAVSAFHAPGPVQVTASTEGGKSRPVSLIIDRFALVEEKEPNDSRTAAQAITLPVTVAGSVARAGDVDWYSFPLKAGEEVGVQVTADDGKKFGPVLKLVGPDGNTVAESAGGALGHRAAKGGTYALGVRDREFRGGAGMGYRLHVGPVPVVTSVFPLGVPRGATTEVRVEGVHLGAKRAVKVTVPKDATPGSNVPVPLGGERPLGKASVVVGEFPEVSSGGVLPVPGTANGVIGKAGASQTWKFQAKKGEKVILEAHAARLGSPLDSTIEILDAAGRPLPRAVLRCLARTYSVFRDHDSRGGGIRIETWSELAMNDYLLVGSQLLRIRQLPRNPDDDCQFFQEQGQRLGYLGTTPAFVSVGTPMYKVSMHPPGTKLPPNGLPLVTLFWRNDDGGPGLDGDSRLGFVPPADGTYQVRITDARGEGSAAHAYRLTARPPRPDFSVSFSPTSPGVPVGGAVPVNITINRVDGFGGVVDVELRGLPAGLSAPKSNIGPLDNSTSVPLNADPGAKLPDKLAPISVVARATINGKPVERTAAGGTVKLDAGGELRTATEQVEVTIKPGGEARVTVNIERRNGFKGRVPLDVRGLPHGVRVLDVGLNGILVVPGETRRTFVLYCEPWVKPTEHPIVVLSRVEGKPTEYAAKAVLLRVAAK